MSDLVKCKLNTFWSDSLVTCSGLTLPNKAYRGFTEEGLELILIPNITHCHEQGGSYDLNDYIIYEYPSMIEIDKEVIKGNVIEVDILDEH